MLLKDQNVKDMYVERLKESFGDIKQYESLELEELWKLTNLLFILLAVCTWSTQALLPPYAYANPYSSYPAQPALTSQHQNILRSPYNLGQITTFSKTVDTPFSSVSKSDVRVSNPGLAVPALRYAAPVVSHVGIAAPYAAHIAAPFATPVAKVATAGGLLGVAYSAAPAVSHMTYTNGLGLAYAW